MADMMEQVNWYGPVFYGLMIGIGAISCFFGFKLFKLLLTLVMALGGALALSYAGWEAGNDPVMWSIGGFVIGGLVGGILAYFFYAVAVAALGGIAAGTAVMPFVQDYQLPIQVVVVGIIAAFAAVLTVAVTNLAIQISAAVLGALLIVHGTNYFMTGEEIEMVEGDAAAYVVYLEMSPTMGLMAVVLAVAGFFMQRRWAKRN